MKKLENLGKMLSMEEKKKIKGGSEDPPGCIDQYGYDCAKDTWPGGTCCANLHCEVNATNSGTICMAN